jgi:hypothetical protein
MCAVYVSEGWEEYGGITIGGGFGFDGAGIVVKWLPLLLCGVDGLA